MTISPHIALNIPCPEPAALPRGSFVYGDAAVILFPFSDVKPDLESADSIGM